MNTTQNQVWLGMGVGFVHFNKV